MNSADRSNLAGFTIVELMLTLVVMSFILAATTSSMRLMLRTASSTKLNTAESGTTSRAAVDQVIDDLKLALTVPEQSPTAVTMTVPDRDGDNQPETIRYSWSGVAGDPLKRSYNGSAAVSIADNITSFNVQHLLRIVGPVNAATRVESGEQLFASSNALLLVSNANIDLNKQSAQYFCPNLPANTISWKVTRIGAEVKRNGSSTGNMQFDITAADSTFLPSGTALDTGLVPLTNVPAGSTGWVEFPCTALTGLRPGQGLCIVARCPSGTSTYATRYAALSLSGAGYFMTCNSGSWGSPNALQTMQFYVYGTVTTQP